MRIVKFLLVFLLLSMPVVALAAGGLDGGLPKQIVPCDGTGVSGGASAKPCDLCAFGTLIQNILNLTVYLAIVGAALLFAYAGWLMLSSAEDPGRRTTGRSIFTSATIGLIIILGGWLAIDTVMKSVLNESKFGPWNKICGESYSTSGDGLNF
ncbi:MAG: hypothetical protein KBE09_03950 [Candidatus Pacebacteria bacterium]|nr:hypothetical protein [Candidatus Paceibacterota bacterium]